MSSQKIAFPNPFQAKDAHGGSSTFQGADFHMDYSEALSLYGKNLRGFSNVFIGHMICWNKTHDLWSEDMIEANPEATGVRTFFCFQRKMLLKHQRCEFVVFVCVFL